MDVLLERFVGLLSIEDHEPLHDWFTIYDKHCGNYHNEIIISDDFVEFVAQSPVKNLFVNKLSQRFNCFISGSEGDQLNLGNYYENLSLCIITNLRSQHVKPELLDVEISHTIILSIIKILQSNASSCLLNYSLEILVLYVIENNVNMQLYIENYRITDVLLDVVNQTDSENYSKVKSSVLLVHFYEHNKYSSLSLPNLKLFEVLHNQFQISKMRDVLISLCICLEKAMTHDHHLLSNSLDLRVLIQRVIEFIVGCDKVFKMYLIRLLRQICSQPELRVCLAMPELGVAPILVSMMIDKDASESIDFYRLLATLTTNERNHAVLVSTELSLLSSIMRYIDDHDTIEIDMCNVISGIIWNLSCCADETVLAEYIQQIPICRLLSLYDRCSIECHRNMRRAVIYIIMNTISLRIRKDVNIAASIDFHNLINLVLQIVDGDGDDLRYVAIGILWNIVEVGDDDACELLLQRNAHVQILNIMKAAGPDKVNWKICAQARNSNISIALNFMMNMARHQNSISRLKQIKLVDAILPIVLIRSNGCECLKGMFIIAFIVGKDEGVASVALLHARPDTIDMLVSVLTDTLDAVKTVEYPLGTFCIKLIIHAVLALSVSDVHKSALLKTNIILLLKRVLENFLNNDPEIPNCGGGGEDLASASLSIGALLHLSFSQEQESDLQKYLMPPELGLMQLLDALVLDNSRLPLIAKRSAGQLRQRLTPCVDIAPGLSRASSCVTNNVTEVIKSSHRHIMLSYSWDSSANPSLARKLCSELRKKGYDIWRDEDGSSLVPPISGSIDDSMALAVQKSDVVIICVSAKYKQSSNCRMEANYASHLAKRGWLKLLFVMMNEEYTTSSFPEFCDGWLGIMIGSSLWYPLWNEAKLATTVDELCKALGETGKVGSESCVSLNYNSISMVSGEAKSAPLPAETLPDLPRLSPISSSSSTNTSMVTPTADPNEKYYLIHNAWKIITDNRKIQDQQGLIDYLDHLGVTDADDLEHCGKIEVESIANFLKIIPKTAFLKCYQRLNELSGIS